MKVFEENHAILFVGISFVEIGKNSSLFVGISRTMRGDTNDSRLRLYSNEISIFIRYNSGQTFLTID